MARLSFAVLFVLFLIGALGVDQSHGKVSEEVQLVLPHGGGINGKYMTSTRGNGIRAFFGIPYAEPPVGPLRFRNPVPKLPWTGYIETTMDTKVCPQLMGMQTDKMMGDEDCLYLNVFTPLRPKTNGPLPVMLFIHGGAFIMGSGGGPMYTPEHILDHDVVLVSINYRLGAFGFLSLGTSECPGNFGLKDQLLTLQWVQDNIAAFNGDPGRVTIFGESAGSASVHYHLTSMLSHKLFHRAILQSGTTNLYWAFQSPEKNWEKAQEMGSLLNCELSNGKSEFLECLQSKPAEEIANSCAKITNFLSDISPPFGPTLEPPSAEAFIAKKPDEYNRYHGLSIPIMIGYTSEEGLVKTVAMTTSDEVWEASSLDQDATIAANAILDEDQDIRGRQFDIIKQFYFPEGHFDRDNIDNLTDFVSDTMFLFGGHQFLQNRLIANPKSADTYVYLYTHRNRASLVDLIPMMMGFPVTDKELGVCHGDDLMSLFPMSKAMLPQLVPTPEDDYMQQLVTELWVNFATTGNPTESMSDVDWVPSRGFPLDYFRMGNYKQTEKPIIGMERGFYEDRMDIWRQVRSIRKQGSPKDEF